MSGSLMAYCDESGQRDYGTGTDNYFVVAGVVVNSSDATHLEDELSGLKRTFFGRPDVELKSNWVRIPSQRAKHYAEPHGITASDIDALVGAIYRWARRAPVTLLAGVVDKRKMEERYVAPHYAGGVAYNLFLQRLQKLSAKRLATSSLVFDDPAGKSPGGNEWRTLLKRQHAQLLKHGCAYTPMKFTSIGGLVFTDSKTSPLVQLADVVAYNVFRQFRDHGDAWEDITLKKLPTYKYFGEILSSFDLGPSKQFASYGVVKWPVDKKVAWCVA